MAPPLLWSAAAPLAKIRATQSASTAHDLCAAGRSRVWTVTAGRHRRPLTARRAAQSPHFRGGTAIDKTRARPGPRAGAGGGELACRCWTPRQRGSRAHSRDASPALDPAGGTSPHFAKLSHGLQVTHRPCSPYRTAPQTCCGLLRGSRRAGAAAELRAGPKHPANLSERSRCTFTLTGQFEAGRTHLARRVGWTAPRGRAGEHLCRQLHVNRQDKECSQPGGASSPAIRGGGPGSRAGSSIA